MHCIKHNKYKSCCSLTKFLPLGEKIHFVLDPTSFFKKILISIHEHCPRGSFNGTLAWIGCSSSDMICSLVEISYYYDLRMRVLL